MRRSLMTLAGVGLIAGTVAIEMQTTVQEADPSGRNGHIHGGVVQKGREKAVNTVQPGETTPQDPPSLPVITTKGHAATVSPGPQPVPTDTGSTAATGVTGRTVTPPTDGKGINQAGVRRSPQ